MELWQIALTYLYFFFFLAMSIIDWKTHLVSDSLNIPASIISIFIIGSTFNDYLNNFYIWAGIGIFFYIGIIRIYTKIRGIQVMGEGDVPILMGMGAILGIEGFITAIFLSALSGIILFLIAKEKEIAFIPPLFIGTVISFILKYVYNIDNIFLI
jgi:prepilin signal peptidase PulO-like enzyme (type II secretory pathway)